jgi:hypothetical protein
MSFDSGVFWLHQKTIHGCNMVSPTLSYGVSALGKPGALAGSEGEVVAIGVGDVGSELVALKVVVQEELRYCASGTTFHRGQVFLGSNWGNQLNFIC